MEILMISTVLPFPLDAGGSIGLFKIIDDLRQRNNITLICPFNTETNVNGLKKELPNVDIRVFGKKILEKEKVDLRYIAKRILTTQKVAPLAKMLLDTNNLIPYFMDDLIEVTKQVLAEKTYDAIEVDFIEIAPIIHFLPKNIKKVFVHHEIRHRRMMQEYQTLGNQAHEGEIWKIENTKVFEIGLLSLYDKVLVLTDNDKIKLIEDGVDKKKIEVSPLPVEIKETTINQPFDFKNKLIYLGPEIHYPNYDAIKWFLENCWIQILQKNPKLKLEIIGKWSKESISLFSAYKHVVFKGYVQHLEHELDGAIMIIPLRIGGGMRMKILEGAAWHTPMISTSIGAEGLPMIHEENCFIANTDTEFINGILELCENPKLQDSFVKKSKKLFEIDFSAETCGQKRENILKT